MNELVKTLQARIADLEREVARYENGRRMILVEMEYWRGKYLDSCATHGETFPTPRGQAQA